jgi:alanine dehydrogenase
MIVGVPKETKNAENRVALTPGGAETLVANGHRILIQKGAGVGSGFTDKEYGVSGAEIADSAESVFTSSDFILKVKEPLPSEYALLDEGQILFTYLHLAASYDLTQNLLERKIVGIGYETVELDDKSLPLLTPMSEIAGRMAPQEGAKYLEETYGGRGILLGGVPGVPPAQVLIIGSGTVGSNAARIALGMGAGVTVLDIDPRRLRTIDERFGGRITTMIADNHNVRMALGYADLVIAAALIHGAKAPRLISREGLKEMKSGAVLVDVAIDQGGCAETSRPTTHSNPIYVEEDVVHYAVTNMPGAVPRTATRALTLNTLPYILSIANKGWQQAVAQDRALQKGVNLVKGNLTYKAVGEVFALPYRPVLDFV